MMSKTCAFCSKSKQIKEFYKRGGEHKVSPRSVCKECYWKNQRLGNKKWRHTPHGRFLTAKKIAKMHKRSWNISEEDFNRLIILPCHYCKRLSFETGIGLDRINNELDYKVNNVLPCCGTCNRIRCHLLTVEEMEVVMATLIRFRIEKAIKQNLTKACFV